MAGEDQEKRGPPGWVLKIQVELMWGAIRILRALPRRWALRFADGVARFLYRFNGRGRRTAYQNVRVAFGDELPPDEATRLVKSAFRESARAALFLVYAYPATEERIRDWVIVPKGFDESEVAETMRGGFIGVSAHVGNWELLLAIRLYVRDLPELVFVAEPITRPAVNQIIERLRQHGGIAAAERKGSVLKLVRALKRGKFTGILADRNVRGKYGGIYAPFLGVPARTTPAPAWLALTSKAPLLPLFLFPEGDKYRLWVGPDLARDLPDGTQEERMRVLTARVNHVIGTVVRAAPESWNWSLKRWKGRPTRELGPYPPYSRYDPD